MKGKTQWEKLPYPYDTKSCKYPYYSLTNQLKPELPKGKSLLNIPENPYEPWHYTKGVKTLQLLFRENSQLGTFSFSEQRIQWRRDFREPAYKAPVNIAQTQK